MPPVRWKLVAVVAACLIHISSAEKAGKAMALTDDGWRPIVGHRDPSQSEEVTQYRNPSSNLETIKVNARPSTSAPIPPPQPPPPKPTASTVSNNIHNQHHGQMHHRKVPPHIKHQQVHYVANQGQGSQYPIIMHRSQNKIHKIPILGKTHGPVPLNRKQPMKTVRVPVGAHSTRDEVFAAAPSTGIGNYVYFTQGQSQLQNQLKQQQQQQAQIDFANHFGPNADFFQFQRLPVQQYVLPKQPIPNDIHYTFQAQNDEYTRNLVPPLPSKQYQDKEKQKVKPIFKQKEPLTEAVSKQQAEQTQASVIPENILVQVPPSYQQQTYYVPNHNVDEQAVDVQVTKEKLKVYHNNVPPPSFNPLDFSTYFQFGKKPSDTPKLPTYEVTEGKVWQQTPPIQQEYVRGPERRKRPQVVEVQVEKLQPFLPTPLKPSGLAPTSPTQSEISTIYTELSQINRHKEQIDPTYFNVKEVSTHYPIVGQPGFRPQYNVQYTVPVQDNPDNSNEITTIKPRPQVFVHEEIDTTEVPTKPPATTAPTRSWQEKRRPNHRRRRPNNRSRPTTTEEPAPVTDYYETQRNEEVEQTTLRERPLRRRPTRYRTTEAPRAVEERPQRTRYRQRPRPTEESTESIEMPYNHKTEYYQKPLRGSYSVYDEQYQKTTEKEFMPNFENLYTSFGKYDNNEGYQNVKKHRIRPYGSEDYNPPTKYKAQDENEEQSEEAYSEEVTTVHQKYRIEENISEESPEQTDSNVQEEVTEEVVQTTKRPRRPLVTSTTEAAVTTSIHIPENEVDYSTAVPQHETITIKEVHTQEPEVEETTLPITTTTTTTTPEPTTTKSNRLRRPINYKSSRPRFSVKEYRQRLNQYTSTTTESNRATTEPARSRFANRSRKPLVRQPEVKVESSEEATEAPRTKFVPKAPRYGTNQEPRDDDTSDRPIKTTNSRLRPFGRYRSTTTEATTTQKISIKPNIFNNLRRPAQVSLRSRIYNRYNRNSTTEKPTKAPEVEPLENLENETSDVVESTELYDKQRLETTTTDRKTPDVSQVTTTTKTTTADSVEDEVYNNMDILKNEEFLQLQRVSDLTSSAQNDYNTPGIFKSVSSNVRRVPSYFTIATDDPILPIEAFFPNINKEKDKHK